MTQPDLFVVCKNCGAEVSPYVTECPYCGQRVRKRAPKLDRGNEPQEAAPKRRRRAPQLPRLRADEIEGIAPDTRPVVTIALIAISLVTTLVAVSDETLDLGTIVVPGADEVWRWFTAPFVHGDAIGYQFVTLVAVGIFGSMLERRFGPVLVVLLFVLCGAAGSAVAVNLEVPPLFSEFSSPLAQGANGAALGLLTAWLVDDRRAARRGHSRDYDLLGAGVIAALLVLLSVAVEEANIGAAAGGAVAGALLGLLLPIFTRR